MRGWVLRRRQLLNAVMTPPDVAPYMIVGLRVFHPPFSAQRTLRLSSAWPTLRRNAVRRLLDVIENDHRLVRHYRRTYIPDESFYATVLLNDPDLHMADDTLRFLRWVGPHPRVLRLSDLRDMLQSPDLFARKVDLDVDAALLDALDVHIAPSGHGPSNERSPHQEDTGVS